MTYLVKEMEEFCAKRRLEQEPKAEISAGPDPLVFVNSDISLESVRLHLARYSIKDLRQRVGTMAGVIAAIAVVVTLGVWTWLDQHRYAELSSNSLDLFDGYPNWNIGKLYPRLLWTFDLRRDNVDPKSSLKSHQLVVTKPDDPATAISIALTKIGRAKFLFQIGRSAEATSAARSIIHADGVSKDDAYQAKDIIIASAQSQNGASIADLVNDEKIVATRALQRIAVIDPDLFAQMLTSGQKTTASKFDPEQVFPFFPSRCTGSVAGYVDRVFDREWSFTPPASDLLARTKCIPPTLKRDINWNHTNSSQAYLRRLLTPSQDGGALAAGLEKFVVELVNGGADDLSGGRTPSARLSNALDAAVVFDNPQFQCSESLSALIRKLSSLPHDAYEGVSIATYLIKYCGGRGIKSSGGDNLVIDSKDSPIDVPLTALDASSIRKLETEAPAIVLPLVTYQFAMGLRESDKLELIYAMPDLPESAKLLQTAANSTDEDVQTAALLWVLKHRPAEINSMIEKPGLLLLDHSLLLISVFARADKTVFQTLKSHVPNSNAAGPYWAITWGDFDAAIAAITKPDAEDRKNAYECLAFRNDLKLIRDHVIAANNRFYSDVVSHIDRAILEHDRIESDIRETPAPLKVWRAGVDYTETFGGKLLIASLIPDPDLRFRETIKFGPLSRGDDADSLLRPQ
jgi:hypothetical protein